jgi:hypothetical protein
MISFWKIVQGYIWFLTYVSLEYPARWRGETGERRVPPPDQNEALPSCPSNGRDLRRGRFGLARGALVLALFLVA